MTVSESFNRALVFLGVKKIDIARKTGIAPQTLNKYFTGKESPTIKNLIKIADGYGLSVDYLLGRSDSPNLENKNVRSEVTKFISSTN